MKLRPRNLARTPVPSPTAVAPACNRRWRRRAIVPAGLHAVVLSVLLAGALAAPPVAAAEAAAPATSSPALAGTLSVEPSGDVPGELRLVWTLLNEGGEARAVELPAVLPVSVTGRHGELGLQAVRIDPSAAEAGPARVRVEPGRFHRVRYRLVLPSQVDGPLVFRRAGEGDALVAFADLPRAPLATGQPDARAAAVPPGPPGNPAPSTPPAATPRTPVTDRLGSAISAHEPNYIAFGARDRRSARFQISFRFRFFNEEGDLARQLTPLRHLYFGYTQTALWDLEADSAPFRDSSYRPSVFYRNDALWTSPSRGLRLGLAAGLEHESNGRDGVSSRSINTAFVRPLLRLGDPAGWQLTLGPRFHAYLDRDGNPDIARYRGHADLFASIGRPDRWQFAATVRRGTGNDAGSTQLEATYPLRAVSLGNLDGYVFFQYFNGYGESLLDYNRRMPAQFRAGFAITRWP